ncbi:MAG: shikimate dehydrogenase [Methylophilaceae bacterium]|nr:shikimate dehydrogenase [Methylophilaceae bacterium]MBL6791210.1 shikimate dehydrogenase [Methylophilaceae bacterium]
MKNTKKFAVVGHPIAHSKSPTIHNLFAAQFGIALEYRKFDFPSGCFKKEVDNLKKMGYFGLNITLPFKHEAYLYCEKLSEKVKQTSSVNTITFKNDCAFGDTTDGIGLVKDLLLQGVKLSSSNILLLGAGGAAQGVLIDLLENQPMHLSIFNRTQEKAKNLVDAYQSEAQKKNITLSVFDPNSNNFKFDLVINATSAGILGDELFAPKNIFQSSAFFYDMTYGKDTAFLKAAKNCRAQFSDGLGMLVCQAAESFRLWHEGLEPNTLEVINKLQKSF